LTTPQSLISKFLNPNIETFTLLSNLSTNWRFHFASQIVIHQTKSDSKLVNRAGNSKIQMIEFQKNIENFCLGHFVLEHLNLFRISPACAKPRLQKPCGGQALRRRQGFRASNLSFLLDLLIILCQNDGFDHLPGLAV